MIVARDRQKGQYYLGGEKCEKQKGKSILESVFQARKCCLSQKTLPVVFRFELFRRKIEILCVIPHCPDTKCTESGA